MGVSTTLFGWSLFGHTMAVTVRQLALAVLVQVCFCAAMYADDFDSASEQATVDEATMQLEHAQGRMRKAKFALLAKQKVLDKHAAMVRKLDASIPIRNFSLAGTPRETHGPLHTTLDYDTEAFPFAQVIADLLGVEARVLPHLHNAPLRLRMEEEGREITLENDPYIQRFYAALRAAGQADRIPNGEKSVAVRRARRLVAMYHRFVRHVLQQRFPANQAMLFQTLPSIRIHYPGGTTVPYHYDADPSLRSGPEGEQNFLVPLTPMRNTNSMYIESRPGARDFEPVSLRFGELLHFAGNKCVHGNEPNEEGLTRVSFDFRLLPRRHYVDFVGTLLRGPWDSHACTHARTRAPTHAPSRTRTRARTRAYGRRRL